MRTPIHDVLVRIAFAAIVAASAGTLRALPGEPEHAVRSLRGDHAPGANPLCARRPVKMPCLQPDGAAKA